MKYCAFISYRHIEPDKTIAQRLHTAIETYALPGALAKAKGKKKMGRVFRDEEELPLSTDLGQDITGALQESEWLIVVCSPDLLKSKWCMKEIDTFIGLGRKDHILTVLARGEPDESFPAQLRFEEINGVTVEKEPLAADLRAKTTAGMIRALRGEKLRLLAPMLGVSYDDLRRRAKERRLKTALTGSAAALLLAVAFSAYAVIQNRRIEAQRVLAAGNQAQLLIEKSLLRSAQDEKPAARSLALNAYAVTDEIGGRYAREALSALAAACYSGDFDTLARLEDGNMRLYSLAFSPDDRSVLGISNYNSVVMFDADTGVKRFAVCDNDAALDTAVFSPDGSVFLTACYAENSLHVYETRTGAKRLTYVTPDASSMNELSFAAFLGSEALIHENGELRLINMETGEARAFGEALDPYARVSLSGAGETIALCATDGSGMIELRRADGSGARFDTGVRRGIWRAAFSPDGRLLAADAYGAVVLLDAETGEIVWQWDSGASQMSAGLSFSPDGESLACLYADQMTLLKADTGEKVYALPLSGQATDAAARFIPGGMLYVDSDPVRLYDARSGEALFDLSEYGLKITAVNHAGSVLLTTDTSGGARLSNMAGYGTQETVEKYSGALFDVPNWSPLKREANLTNPYYDEQPANAPLQSKMYVSPDGRFAVIVNDGTYIKIWDLDRGDALSYRLYEHSYGIGTMCLDVAFSADSGMLATAGYDGRSVIYDLTKGEIVRVLAPCEWKTTLAAVKFSADGAQVMLTTHARDAYYVYSVSDGALLYRLNAKEAVSAFGFDEESGDAVVAYETGGALIGRLFKSDGELLAYADGLK